MTETPNPPALDLAAIEARVRNLPTDWRVTDNIDLNGAFGFRLKAASGSWMEGQTNDSRMPILAANAAADIPALIAEVRRLEGALALAQNGREQWANDATISEQHNRSAQRRAESAEAQLAELQEEMLKWAVPALEQCLHHFETCAGHVDVNRTNVPLWLTNHIEATRNALDDDTEPGERGVTES